MVLVLIPIKNMTKEKEAIKQTKTDVTPTSAAATLQQIKDSLVPGMTIRLHQKIKELNLKGQEKERVQYFEGLIVARKHGKEAGSTITVSKNSDGVDVDKIFPLNLPTITKIEIKKEAKVRRAKLSFLKKDYKKKLKAKK